MNLEQVAKLIEVLESVRRRPAMYVGCLDVERMVHFLSGFQIAWGAVLGFERYRDTRNKVVENRGWNESARHSFHQMVERGMSPEQIIDELVTVEIDVLQRLAGGLSERE